MKGNKMSAILAILLMLTGALAVIPFAPYAHAQGPGDIVGTAPSAMGVTPATIVKQHATFPPGSTFEVNITITDVIGLYTFGVGLYYNATYLKIANYGDLIEGPFLKNQTIYNPSMIEGTTGLQDAGAIDNVHGILHQCGDSLEGTEPAINGSGVLMSVIFTVLSPPYTGTSPGSPIQDVGLVTQEFAPSSPAKIKLQDYYGNYIDPPESAITNGTFELQVVPVKPVAGISIISPLAPPYYQNSLLTLNATGSKPGSDGLSAYDSPIVCYNWWLDNGTGWITVLTGPSIVVNYTTAGNYKVWLNVTDAYGGPYGTSTNASLSFSISPPVHGCVVDAFTQNWRYIDPHKILNVPRGKGWNQTADLFRPGDWVQVFVVTEFNLDPVRGQMVGIEVFDNNHNIVAIGSATTNGTGCAEYDFRIPYPVNPTSIFGTWEVYVTWEIGTTTGLIPFSQTQNDTLWFLVGWGVYSTDLTINPGSVSVGGNVNVSYTLYNQYMEAVTVVNTVTVYDDLGVPVAYTSQSETVNPQSSLAVGPITLTLPIYTFVGTGTVKADEMTAFPNALGIAWGPEQVQTFIILHTNTPSDP